MIEGLKVTIKGAELRTLCSKRANYHRERSRVYGEQLSNFEAAQIEGMNYSGGDPKRALSDKKNQHEAEAGELDFIADHIVASEEYLLASSDLAKIGIVEHPRW